VTTPVNSHVTSHTQALRKAAFTGRVPYAFVVDAKDDKAAQFCQRYRFMPVVAGGRRLFIPMAEIAKLFA